MEKPHIIHAEQKRLLLHIVNEIHTGGLATSRKQSALRLLDSLAVLIDRIPELSERLEQVAQAEIDGTFHARFPGSLVSAQST